MRLSYSLQQGCGVWGKMSNSHLSKISDSGSNFDSDLSKISDTDSQLSIPYTPTPSHNMNEVWLSTIVQQPAHNGSLGTQQEFCASVKVSKKLCHFNRHELGFLT